MPFIKTGFKYLGYALLWLLVAVSLAVVIVPPFLDRIYYQGPVSGHYDGARFFNTDEGQGEWVNDPVGRNNKRPRSFFILRWITGNDDRQPWPESVAVATATPAKLDKLKPGEMRATWIGHATVLIETPGFTMLTDPIWSERAGPWGILGPKRVTAPGIALEDLPKIDLVVVSHNHYDHLDLATLKKLWERDKPAIVTSLGNDSIINGIGVPSLPMDWGANRKVGKATVHVTRNHHWGSRWFKDRNRALWSSFTVDTPSGSVFFAGDTGYGDGKWPGEAAAAAGGPIRLAIIPIGAFRFGPGQMWTGSHIGPHHAVKVFEGLNAHYGLPIHWGTFQLSSEARETPPKMLALEAACAGLAPDAFAAKAIGTPFMVPEVGEPKLPASAPKPVCDKAAIEALP